MRASFVILLCLSLATAGVYYRKEFQSLLDFVEQTPPNIELENPVPAIGSTPREVRLHLSDTGAGVDSVSIELAQNETTVVVAQEVFSGKSNIITPAFNLSAPENGFEEGKLTMTISASDKTLWKNTTQKQLELELDLSPPKLNILSVQHNVRLGGSALAVFNASDIDLANAYIQVGPHRFPSYPVNLLEPGLNSPANVYFSMFAIPVDSEPELPNVDVRAIDRAGNRTEKKLSIRLLKRRYPTEAMKASEKFIESKFAELRPAVTSMLQAQGTASSATDSALAALSTIARFKLLNERLRAYNEFQLAKIFAKTKAKKLWEGEFIRPLHGKTTAAFGEFRRYSFQSAPAGRSLHAGLDLASVERDTVLAANSGAVVFADELGIYGTSIVIDHGLGLFSLYSHLSAPLVTAGTTVDKGQVIGKTGATGFAGGDHLHYEVRIHGIPVSPIEWWDKKWINDHIHEKIVASLDLVRQQAGLP